MSMQGNEQEIQLVDMSPQYQSRQQSIQLQQPIQNQNWREQHLNELKKIKEENEQISSIEFLIQGEIKWKEDLRKLISLYFDNYQKKNPDSIIRQESNCLFCLFKKSLEIGGFKKSWSKCVGQENEKRFYGSIYFDNQDQNYMISQTLKEQDFKELEDLQKRIEQMTEHQFRYVQDTVAKKIFQYYDNDEIMMIQKYNRKYLSQLNYDYQDMNSDYLYGKRCGYGFEITTIQNQQKLYIGDFFNNKYHGKGIFLQGPFDIKIHKKEEEEEFFAGEREKSIFSFLHGDQNLNQNNVFKLELDIGSYHGEMRDNKRNGWGILEFKNGNKYKGQWKDNKMHGMGYFTWKNGEEYLGEYFKGIKHGFGRYIYQEKKIYLGQFKDGKQHGFALVQNSTKLNLLTEWRNGQLVV